MTTRRPPMRIGTSGWSYKHWIGPFYPPELKARDHLAFYFARFDTVELNNSFYHLPRRETFENWRAATPPDFEFTVKANRFITHVKRLKDPAEPVARFFENVEALGGKCGPILFQCPPRWGVNPARLREFLGVLPAGYRFAFEFRDPSWFDDAVYEILRAHNAAFCFFEIGGLVSPRVVTADWIYVRLHGPDGPYAGSYSDAALAEWAVAMKSWRAEGRQVYAYFDNDQYAYAVKNALTLRGMVQDRD